MDYQTLEIETRNRVATVWMNRPEVHNAFDESLIRELTQAFERLDRDEAVRVVVLGGRGKSFSAGADLNWMKRAASYTVERNLRDARALAQMLKTIDRLSKPTVARVQGAALGGGTGLTTACNIAIASTQASFATTEVKFGIIPAAISPYVIAAIGSRRQTATFSLPNGSTPLKRTGSAWCTRCVLRKRLMIVSTKLSARCLPVDRWRKTRRRI
jgi:methylglutaconyl-CoA hydratase